MTRVLITGAGGQMGTELRRAAWPAGTELRALDHRQFNLTDHCAIDRVIGDGGFDVVINAAAYTAVDRAESEPELAHAINATGAGHLADACRQAGAALIHYSTDFVFDGCKTGPYVEDDPVAPLSVYGQSKAAGEAAIREVLDRHVILRTAWLHAAHGQNFVRTMLRLGRERSQVRVVDDQIGCPTAADDVADAVVAIVSCIHSSPAAWGTFHCCSSGTTSWYGLAAEIFRLQRELTMHDPELIPITTADYPTPALRPANSRLDCQKLSQTFGIDMPPWQDGVRRTVTALLTGSTPMGQA